MLQYTEVKPRVYIETTEVCQAAGFKPTNLCTPTELMEEMHVKEKPNTRTDPILEECYRIKEELAAQFNSILHKNFTIT